MEAFLIREWDIVLPRWSWLYEYQFGVSTPWGAVPTRETTVFVRGWSEL